MGDGLMVGFYVGQGAECVVQYGVMCACLSQHVDADVLRYPYGQSLGTLKAIQPVAHLP